MLRRWRLETLDDQTMIDKYRQYAEACAQTDYGDKKSVRRHNQSAAGMRKIVEDVAKKGADAIEKLFPLLNEPECANWLAFQLLELAEVNQFTEARCLRIIKDIAAGEGAEAMGTQVWLTRWKDKSKTSSNKEDAPGQNPAR